ncbi:hypothetical protein C8J56DRAFT_1172576 [Mycena floridula]|nr:hypothetical protein C8J56DRAFT_1172576 [Mycena floridula]
MYSIRAPPSSMDPVINLLEFVVVNSYIIAGCVTVVIWDSLLTLGLEVSLVWSRQSWSLGKVLFVLNRYVPLLFLTVEAIFLWDPTILPSDSNSCRIHNIVRGALQTLVVVTVQTFLIIRTYALYRTRVALYSLGCLLIIPSIVAFALALQIAMADFPQESPSLPALCALPCTNPARCKAILIFFWIHFILLDTVVISLTLWKYYETRGFTVVVDADNFSQLQIGNKLSLLRYFVFDGLVYYLAILAVAVLNFTLVINDLNMIVGEPIATAVQSTACSRMFLNLRWSTAGTSCLTEAESERLEWYRPERPELSAWNSTIPEPIFEFGQKNSKEQQKARDKEIQETQDIDDAATESEESGVEHDPIDPMEEDEQQGITSSMSRQVSKEHGDTSD